MPQFWGGIPYRSKLTLTINRLLFKNWPNEAIRLQNYASTVEGMETSTADSLSGIDSDSGEVIGPLALTQRKPASADESKAVMHRSQGYQDSSMQMFWGGYGGGW